MSKLSTLFTKKILSYFFIAVIIISGAAYAAITYAHSSGHNPDKTSTQPFHHSRTPRPVTRTPVVPPATETSVPPSETETETETPVVPPATETSVATETPVTPSASSTPSSSGSGAQVCSGCWLPTVDTSLQWQLQGTIDQSYVADLYDIDGFDNSSTVVSQLHEKGYKAVCYVSAGSWEDWRADASQFPSSVLGKELDGWPGEKWLDIRQLTVLGPLMQARVSMCKSKGFDVMEFDNVDGYSNNTGFPLTEDDQLTYNIWLANQAHQQNMAVLLKNDPDQATSLLPYFDGVLDEQCFEYEECDKFVPFIQAGKPVFEVEYNLSSDEFCSQANSMNFFAQVKDLDLDASRTLCRTAGQ
jgi:hypothetical protein